MKLNANMNFLFNFNVLIARYLLQADKIFMETGDYIKQLGVSGAISEVVARGKEGEIIFGGDCV